MKNTDSKWRKYSPAHFNYGRVLWTRLGRYTCCRVVGDKAMSNGDPNKPDDTPISPLDNIKAYLLHHNLSSQVQVRLDNVTGGFVLEDEDGLVSGLIFLGQCMS